LREDLAFPIIAAEAKMKRFGIMIALLIMPALPRLVLAENIRADLTGYEEVPAVSTVATGEFRGTISKDEQSIEYELTYSDLQGTVTQGHIHVAQKSVNGGIVLWLCETETNLSPTPPTPTCPPGSGTVSGVLTAANVLAGNQPSQQLTAGDLAEVIRAIRAGAAYVNVHTSPDSTGGEIRGQLRSSKKNK
jgi:hypothetical protein